MRMYAYPLGLMEGPVDLYRKISEAVSNLRPVQMLTVPKRSGLAWPVKQGQVCRVVAVEGPQVGDMNFWNLGNPRERFWAARTRLFTRAHVSRFDRLWSNLPYLRPMVTITNDTVSCEATASGGRCHDLLGSRCDPYLYKLVDDRDVDVTCHTSLSRAIARYHLTELDTHDPLNVFQVTGLDSDDHYFAEPSPARPGDFIEFFAEIDVLMAVSACPGGDLSVPPRGPNRGDPTATCKPLGVEVYDLPRGVLDGWEPPQPVQLGSVYVDGSQSSRP